MATSVGHGHAESCASIRAGISRPCSLTYFEVFNPKSQEFVPLLGHPVLGTEGFFFVGRWHQIATNCLLDLLRSGCLPNSLDQEAWGSIYIIAVTPHLDDIRFLRPADVEPSAFLKISYLRNLLDRLGLPVSADNMSIFPGGHTGSISAISLGIKLLKDGHAKKIIVLAVDSYLDEMSLNWLESSDRLKTEHNPVGLSPGEAGACLLIEKNNRSNANQPPPLAFIHSLAICKEPNTFESGKLMGTGLSHAIFKALEDGGVTTPYFGDVISDHNGENWRASELAYAKLITQDKLCPKAPTLLPALCLGDTGAASAAVSISVAVQAFRRGYSSSSVSIVLSSSEIGDVAALCLQKP